MYQAWKLTVYKGQLLAKHRSKKDIISSFLGIIIAVIIFIVLKNKLPSMPGEKQHLILLLVLLASSAGALFYTVLMAIHTCFSSAEAFYYISTPLEVKEMFYLHYLAISQNFLQLFGHLILPALMAPAYILYGFTGMALFLLLFLALLSFAVHSGFFIMFFLLENKGHPARLFLFIIGLFVLAGSLTFLRLQSLAGFIVAGIILWLLIHQQVPLYIKRVFYHCLDSCKMTFTWQLTSPRLKKLILYNSFLSPVFRAVLYKELITDRRNLFLYLRYLVASLFLLAYLPLSHLSLFERGGIIAALVYSYLVIVGNFHETFSSTFIKEGNMMGFLLPVSASGKLAMAKTVSATIQQFPLVLLGTALVSYRWSLGLCETISLGITLWFLSLAHLLLLIALAALCLNMENREMDFLAGMAYEYLFANVNPRVLFLYMLSLILPALLSGLLLKFFYCQAGGDLWNQLWIVNFFLMAGIIFFLYLEKSLFYKTFQQLRK